MVPQWVTETKLVDVTEYKKEVRQRTVTRYKCVPETKQVTTDAHCDGSRDANPHGELHGSSSRDSRGDSDVHASRFPTGTK